MPAILKLYNSYIKGVSCPTVHWSTGKQHKSSPVYKCNCPEVLVPISHHVKGSSLLFPIGTLPLWWHRVHRYQTMMTCKQISFMGGHRDTRIVKWVWKSLGDCDVEVDRWPVERTDNLEQTELGYHDGPFVPPAPLPLRSGHKKCQEPKHAKNIYQKRPKRPKTKTKQLFATN